MFFLLHKDCYCYISSLLVLPPPPRRFVTAEPVPGESSITVNWRAPVVPREEPAITGYRIRYYIRGNDSDMNIDVSKPPVTLAGLQYSTEYQVHVATRNADGLGPECCGGSPLYVTTSDGKLNNSKWFHSQCIYMALCMVDNSLQ